jgi:hypothetical protein
MSPRDLAIPLALMVLMVGLLQSPVHGEDTYLGTVSIAEDDSVYLLPYGFPYHWGPTLLKIVAHDRGGNGLCTFETIECDEHANELGLPCFVMTSRFVPYDGGQVYYRYTGSFCYCNGGDPTVGLRTWDGGAPADFDVYLTDNQAESPWEDWWYSDIGNPSAGSNGGGIVLDAGTDVSHPYTLAHGGYFYAGLNVRGAVAAGGPITRLEFDLHLYHGLQLVSYSVMPLFSGMQVTGITDGYHVAVWADTPVTEDPVYACEFVIDSGWGIATLENCVFTGLENESWSGECFAALRVNWDVFYGTATVPTTWGAIKAMYN